MVQKEIDSFNTRHNILRGMYMPSCWDSNGKLISLDAYKKKLIRHGTNDDKFSNMSRDLKGEHISKMLAHVFTFIRR